MDDVKPYLEQAFEERRKMKMNKDNENENYAENGMADEIEYRKMV